VSPATAAAEAGSIFHIHQAMCRRHDHFIPVAASRESSPGAKVRLYQCEGPLGRAKIEVSDDYPGVYLFVDDAKLAGCHER
jgi:hypothetical protein